MLMTCIRTLKWHYLDSLNQLRIEIFPKNNLHLGIYVTFFFIIIFLFIIIINKKAIQNRLTTVFDMFSIIVLRLSR